MAEFGFTIAAGNRLEKGINYLGHVVWNPWRAANSAEPGYELAEDLNAGYLAFNHLAQIGGGGSIGRYGGVILSSEARSDKWKRGSRSGAAVAHERGALPSHRFVPSGPGTPHPEPRDLPLQKSARDEKHHRCFLPPAYPTRPHPSASHLFAVVAAIRQGKSGASARERRARTARATCYRAHACKLAGDDECSNRRRDRREV